MTVALMFGLESKSQMQKTVKGEDTWSIVNITPEQSRNIALIRAMECALRNAGVEQKITTELIEIENDDYSVQFSTLETRFLIDSFEIIGDEPLIQDAKLFWTVEIEALVNMKKADPDFDAEIKDIKKYYQESEELKFTVIPTQDCFLTVFLFNALTGENYILYPNADEDAEMLLANTEYFFPENIENGYIPESYKDVDAGIVTLVFVFTKEDIPFDHDELSWEELINRINRIDGDKVETKLISILKKRKS
jgi:hypothetical protein